MILHPGLYPFQVTGAHWLAVRRHAILADEMGVGKSAQAIGACDLIEAKRVLVICPPIARENWRREFDQWQCIRRSTGAIWGSRVFPDTDVTVVGFSSLTSLPAMRYLLASKRFDVLIIDEGHLLKNDVAGRSRSVYGKDFVCSHGLASLCDRKWILSGTLMPNHPGELWTHCHALFPEVARDPNEPGKLMTYPRWTKRYCTTKRGSEKIVGGNADTRAELVARIKPYVLRRTKAQVYPDMPSLRVSQVVLRPDSLPPMPAEIAEAEAVVAGAYAKMSKGQTEDAIRALKAVDEMHLASLRKWTGVAKAQAVAELIAYELKHGLKKIALFVNHRDVFTILQAGIPGSVAIHGGVKNGDKPGQRQYLIDAFQGKIAGFDPPVILVHTEIASTAISLTAANEVGLVEQTWVQKDTDQAIARCWRNGQTRPVSARVFSLAGSSDEAVGATLARKARETGQFNAAMAA